MPNPFFSVITVTYNSSLYVREAIESILASTFTDFELIIGDDCSTDNTWDIINEYNDPRLVKYRNDTNLKEYPNRNKALSVAKGEWVIFIDGDDLIYPYALSFINEMIQRESNIGMILMRWYRNNMFYPVLISPRDFYLEQYFGEGFLGTAFTNVVFNRKILMQLGGLSNNYVYGDDFIRKKIALNHNMMIISDQLTFWRETPKQASQNAKKSINTKFEQIDSSFLFLDLAAQQGILLLDEVNLAKWYISKMLMKDILRNLFKGNFLYAWKFLKRYSKNIVLFKKDRDITPPFSEYSPVNILTLEKSRIRLNS
jgi:glycosyltransferase involved in cell wall biosynthesis